MEIVSLPILEDARAGAGCTLGTDELRERLTAWRALADRAAVAPTDRGAVLELLPDEPMDALARLVTLESECCGFYRFTMTVEGSTRRLEIDAGPGGGAAVRALLRSDERG